MAKLIKGYSVKKIIVWLSHQQFEYEYSADFLEGTLILYSTGDKTTIDIESTDLLSCAVEAIEILWGQSKREGFQTRRHIIDRLPKPKTSK